jgi:hypothetical protein
MTSATLKEIKRFQKLPDGAIVFEIGVALQYLDAPPGVRYSAPYVEQGTELWATACYELQSLLCDKSERAPKEWVDEIVDGNIREVSVATLTILVASMSVPLSIAVPITALIVKKGLRNFCSLKPRKPKRSLSEIILAHRRVKKPVKVQKKKKRPNNRHRQRR